MDLARVLLGRPYVYGLALAGEDGVRHMLRTLRAPLLALFVCGLVAAALYFAADPARMPARRRRGRARTVAASRRATRSRHSPSWCTSRRRRGGIGIHQLAPDQARLEQILQLQAHARDLAVELGELLRIVALAQHDDGTDDAR